jgi:hypothetical protein
MFCFLPTFLYYLHASSTFICSFLPPFTQSFIYTAYLCVVLPSFFVNHEGLPSFLSVLDPFLLLSIRSLVCAYVGQRICLLVGYAGLSLFPFGHVPFSCFFSLVPFVFTSVHFKCMSNCPFQHSCFPSSLLAFFPSFVPPSHPAFVPCINFLPSLNVFLHKVHSFLAHCLPYFPPSFRPRFIALLNTPSLSSLAFYLDPFLSEPFT